MTWTHSWIYSFILHIVNTLYIISYNLFNRGATIVILSAHTHTHTQASISPASSDKQQSMDVVRPTCSLYILAPVPSPSFSLTPASLWSEWQPRHQGFPSFFHKPCMVASGLVAISAEFNPAFTPSTVLLQSNQRQQVKVGASGGGKDDHARHPHTRFSSPVCPGMYR